MAASRVHMLTLLAATAPQTSQWAPARPAGPLAQGSISPELRKLLEATRLAVHGQSPLVQPIPETSAAALTKSGACLQLYPETASSQFDSTRAVLAVLQVDTEVPSTPQMNHNAQQNGSEHWWKIAINDPRSSSQALQQHSIVSRVDTTPHQTTYRDSSWFSAATHLHFILQPFSHSPFTLTCKPHAPPTLRSKPKFAPYENQPSPSQQINHQHKTHKTRDVIKRSALKTATVQKTHPDSKHVNHDPRFTFTPLTGLLPLTPLNTPNSLTLIPDFTSAQTERSWPRRGGPGAYGSLWAWRHPWRQAPGAPRPGLAR